MASPKSGTAGSIVAPAAPIEVVEAVVADPVEASTISATALTSTSGTLTEQEVPPLTPPETPEEAEERTAWIEIELVGEDDKPIPGEYYKIITSDNRSSTGTLDDKGKARLEDIKPGTCKISFPNLDQDAWEKI